MNATRTSKGQSPTPQPKEALPPSRSSRSSRPPREAPGQAAASLALRRATPAAVQTAEPAVVGTPSSISFEASWRRDSEPSGSRRSMMGAKS
jgi:hypothetical protein